MTHPTLADIRAAHERIKPYIHRTPVLTSTTLNAMTGGELYFKCENFQKVGAFKARGAFNAVLSLSAHEAQRGVATHSSGNHAAALSLAARARGIAAHIVMPDNAPLVKKQAVERYGGIITYCEATLNSREQTLASVIAQTSAIEIHPYNDVRIIAGQATAALELMEDSPSLDIIVAPIGGGGLMSGTALTATHLQPSIHVIGCEPELAADAALSVKENRITPPFPPTTIADGLRTGLGTLTFPIIRERVQEIVTVSESGIITAMKLIWEVMKIIVEPSCAVPLAAIIERRVDVTHKRVGIILTGGNVDLATLPWTQQ
jgi:threonine dehydratase